LTDFSVCEFVEAESRGCVGDGSLPEIEGSFAEIQSSFAEIQGFFAEYRALLHIRCSLEEM